VARWSGAGYSGDMGRFFLLMLAFAFAACPAVAQIDSAPKVHARLIAERDEIAPGDTVTIALEEDIRPGWHTYWRNPGDAGAPTEIKWTLPPGWKAGEIQWPSPKELPVGPLMDYGYEGKVWLLSALTAPKDVKSGVTTLKAAVDWLVCKEVCIPEDTTLSLPLAIGAASPAPYATTEEQFAAARAKMPVTSPWATRFNVMNQGLDLFVAAPNLATAQLTRAHFFPLEQDVVKGIAPQRLGTASDGIVLEMIPGKRAHAARSLAGVLVLASPDGSEQAISIDAALGPVPHLKLAESTGLSLPLALLFAVLGGLILNLMPCVLPILAMKALAIASHAGKEGGEAAREGLAYGAGAILSFAALGGAVIALRASGEAIGWGFQLQEPIVVAVFALLMFAVALNLSGVFEVPGIGAGDALARHGGIAGAFFTGVLAVAVAAPCTAPFMAAALGFALTQGDATALLVFLALGLGFAAPFVAIGLSPRLLRLLPKPGAWMMTLRQLLAFPMYATALWLLWVLSVQSGPRQLVVVLAVALALGFGLWSLGVAQSSTRSGRVAGWIAFVLSLSSLALLAPLVDSGRQAVALPSPRGIAAEPYSEARLAALRSQHRAVFVNATAAWCITCMVNEKVAFDDDRVRAAFTDRHVAYLVADWTKRDSAVTALLEAHGRSGVPLYLYFPPDGTEAKTLPQVLTPDEVLGAINSR